MRLITILASCAILAPSLAISPRGRRVDGSKALKTVSAKKGLASTKKKKRVVATMTAGEDMGVAHRYFAAAPEDSRFYFRALGIRGGGAEIPPADGLPGGPPRGGETAAGETPEDILSYGGSHQDQLQGLLAVLAT